ncbi:hypothetical protein ABZ135_37110 [Streptomyces sp. NPDC006339]|uniref:hypothetical protein n=1 Tax=Streptomyces sp. NPDC006339 TaxID=3156755 RepID=UPI0033B99BE4
MNSTQRALAALVLAGAALSLTGTAHAAGELGQGEGGGSILDESLNQAITPSGDSLFSTAENALQPFTAGTLARPI